MKWNGRRLIPAGAIPVYPKKQDDIRELLKPLSEKRDRGNVWVPVLNQPINVQKEAEAPVVSPSPTPTMTMTPTASIPAPSPSTTPTPTPTPSSTPVPPSGTTEANTYLAAILTAGATGITETFSAATQTFFQGLFTNNLWNKMLVFYPHIGGNAGSHAVNGKTPGTKNLTFNNAFLYGNAFGTDPNAGNSWANTSQTDTGFLANFSMGVYLGSPLGTFGGSAMGSRTAGGVPNLIQANTTYQLQNAGISLSSTSGGMRQVSVSGSNIYATYRDTSTSSAATPNTATGLNTYLFARNNNNTADDFTTQPHRFTYIGQGLTDTEMLTMNTLVQAYQTSLGRNVY